MGLAALAAGYAVLALGNGLDRLSIYQEVGGRIVPSFLRAQIHRQEARLALVAGRPQQARIAAARAVRAAPVEPGSSSVLGSVLFASGENALAHDAFRVAGRFGWRDIPAQAYLMLAALAFDDRTSAAERLDAIMRAAPELPASQAAVAGLEADARGQAALMARLAEGPGWLNVYATAAEQLTGLAFANRIAMLEQTAAKGHRPACMEVSDAVNRMAYEAGRFDDARRLWQLACGSAGGEGWVNDPDFRHPLAARPSPFDWTLPGAGGVSTGIERGVLVARNDNLVREEVARQHVLLPAGEAELTWQGTAEGNAAALAGAVQLRCPDGSSAPALGPATPQQQPGRHAMRVMVAPSCRPQLLAVRIDRSAGEVKLDRVTARPITAGGR